MHSEQQCTDFHIFFFKLFAIVYFASATDKSCGRREFLVQLVRYVQSMIAKVDIDCSLDISGDSYTQTGFVDNGTLPSVGNPLGNPPYPVRRSF